MPSIEVFADVCCPFTHVGLRRLVDRRSELGGGPSLIVRAWPLELVNGAPMDGDLIAQEVAAIRDQVAPDLFTGFDRASFPSSSLPALALTAAAYEIGPEQGEAVALAVRWAMFEESMDVSDPEVIAGIARRHSVEMPGPEGIELVHADWNEGRTRGVIGSPYFIVHEEGFFCPGLDISHGEEGFSIAPNEAGFSEFLDRALSV